MRILSSFLDGTSWPVSQSVQLHGIQAPKDPCTVRMLRKPTESMLVKLNSRKGDLYVICMFNTTHNDWILPGSSLSAQKRLVSWTTIVGLTDASSE